MAMVAVLGLVACSGSGSSGSAATSATPSTAGSAAGSAGATSTTTPGAATAARAERRITTPGGTELVVKPPRPTSDYAAKVVYADPVAPTSTFTASDEVQGVPVSDLGDWATRADAAPRRPRPGPAKTRWSPRRRR